MTAPFVYDGAMNGNVFLAYVEQVLVPTLSEGDLYLPPYSPDFNPIENAFAKLRRCCEQRPRGPSRPCGTRSARSSTSSPQPNVPTTSKPQDMNRIKQDGL